MYKTKVYFLNLRGHSTKLQTISASKIYKPLSSHVTFASRQDNFSLETPSSIATTLIKSNQLEREIPKPTKVTPSPLQSSLEEPTFRWIQDIGNPTHGWKVSTLSLYNQGYGKGGPNISQREYS